MDFNQILPSYVEPCIVDRTSDYDWRSVLDFGEYYYPPSDIQEYPSLTLVYNGKDLKLQPEFVHASLSGISIKHYNGKCYQEITEDDTDYLEDRFSSFDCPEEMSSYLWFNMTDNMSDSMRPKNSKEYSYTKSGSFEYKTDSVIQEGQPICMQPRINLRNSFWNIHRPELCKLTWGQKYVSAATVTEHLHEHLTSHGQLCIGFHTEAERHDMLNKELDEYVRLKVLACPKELPPDEPMFDVKAKPRFNPKCKVLGKYSLTEDRYIPIKNDEEIKGKEIRRSKAEFCLTIGKHIPEPRFISSEHLIEESLITPELSSSGEEEGFFGAFYYDWYPYGEEPLEIQSMTITPSATESSSSSEEVCPPLMLDDFCRSVGKADFSDLRCNTDL